MNDAARETLAHATTIAEEYNGDLTVRQLYYRLVAEDLFPEERKWANVNGKWVIDVEGGSKNAEPNYKWLINILTEARMAGDFPIDWLLDRTREAREGRYIGNQVDVDDALENAANELRKAPQQWLWRARWYGQPTHVSVWVEKEALMGVFEQPCERLGVAWFVLRGYSSISALSQFVDKIAEAYTESDDNITDAVVLYFGDHDPDGWEIPRSAERNVEAIAQVRSIDLPPITFKRVALLKSQIDQYRPPPFPAKETSSRFASYLREHRVTTAWELDALRPEVLRALIAESVSEYFDLDIFNSNNEAIAEAREKMKARMKKKGWLSKVLETEGDDE